MKSARVTIFGIWLTLALLDASPAMAGQYHYGTSLVCSQCHTMHYSQQHDYSGAPFSNSPSINSAPLGGFGPYPFLLRNQVNDLCLSCHDGQTFAPDVYGPNTGNYVREAGALPTGNAPYEEWKGHSLGYTGVPPGGTQNFSEGLNCTNCHQPHGNSYYLNLYGVTYAVGTNDLTKNVFVRSWSPTDISTDYSQDNVDFNEPNVHDSGMAQFCRGCHTDFHGQAGDSNMGGSGGVNWLRHPTADASIGAVGGGHSSLSLFASHNYRVKVMSATGQWGIEGQPWSSASSSDKLTPTCITCHRAHGNQNPFGLIYLSGNGPFTEEGDADGVAVGLSSLCRQCHVQ